MSDESAYIELLRLIRKRISEDSLSRPQMDEIALIAEYCQTELPDRFKNIVNDMDESFGVMTSTSRKEALDRLVKIVEVSSRYPSRSKKGDDTSALIPTFELKSTDINRIHELCGQMRKIIFSAEFLDEPHRRRLLNRLAAIEQEIHQPKGIFDVVRAGISDIGETLGKFGKDVKPLTDRMNEVVKIARQATKEYEQLPAPEELKQLPKPDIETGE